MSQPPSTEIRSLVACAACSRQFDASALREGDRFHCHCGETVVVPARRGVEDAKAVKCRSCGAPRDPGAEMCVFCSAEFTLHEQDLNTICPSCATRISDRARFCHHCATEITAVSAAGLPGEKSCPACDDRKLAHRSVGELALLECPGCAGMWLEGARFERLLEKTRERIGSGEDASPEMPRRAAASRGSRHHGAKGARLYRSCPDCSELMHRRNFGKRSGVILDICTDHGVWFDLEELDRVLAWVRKGGERVVAAQKSRERALAERPSYHRRKIDAMAGTDQRSDRSTSGLLGGLLFDLSLGSIFWD